MSLTQKEKFGNSATFNPVLGLATQKPVTDIIVQIPSSINFIGVNMVSVNMGFAITAGALLDNSFSCEVIEPTTGATLQILTPYATPSAYPSTTQCMWSGVAGQRGVLWVHSNWLGKHLKISGEFQNSVIGGDEYNYLLGVSKFMESGIILLNEVVLNTAGTYDFTVSNDYNYGDLIIPSNCNAYKIEGYPASGGGGCGFKPLTSANPQNGAGGGTTTFHLFNSVVTVAGKSGGVKGAYSTGTTTGASYGSTGGGKYGGLGGYGAFEEREVPVYKPRDQEIFAKLGSVTSILSSPSIVIGSGGLGGTGGNSTLPTQNGTDGGDAEFTVKFYRKYTGE